MVPDIEVVRLIYDAQGKPRLARYKGPDDTPEGKRILAAVCSDFENLPSQSSGLEKIAGRAPSRAKKPVVEPENPSGEGSKNSSGADLGLVGRLSDDYIQKITKDYAPFFEQERHSITLVYSMLKDSGLEMDYDDFRKRVAKRADAKFCETDYFIKLNFFNDDGETLRQAFEQRSGFEQQYSDARKKMISLAKFCRLAETAGVTAESTQICVLTSTQFRGYCQKVKVGATYPASLLMELALKDESDDYKGKELALIKQIEAYNQDT